MEGTAIYVYGVAGSVSRPVVRRPPAGLPGASLPVLIEVTPTLWLAAAEVPLELYGSPALERGLKDMHWVADVALAHEAVVEFFTRIKGVSVIPMKLFTMFSTPARAVAEMRTRRRELQSVMRRIASCEEWGVRVLRAPQAAGAAAAAETPEPLSGAAFLRAKKQARDDARASLQAAADAADRAYDALSPVAREATRRDDEAPAGASSPPLLDAAFLVPTASRARFRVAARQAAAACARAGAAMTLSGPWPAYNFVQHTGEGR